MFGLFNLNKPPGVTSRDVVDHVQRLVRPHKSGHAGTLDPLATGVLVVCVGRATRLIRFVQQMPKRYRATFLLGRESDTEDVEGRVIERVDADRPSRDELETTLGQFVGEILQRPPRYSALKFQGQRAYDLARRGQRVELAERPVHIFELKLVRFDYPEFMLDVACGSGTYVRSLGRDIAAAVHTSAVMSSLTRTAIGELDVADAVAPKELNADSLPRHLLPASRATEALPQLTLTGDEVGRVAHGMTIENRFAMSDEQIAAVDHRGDLVAILTPRRTGGLRPTHSFVAAR